MTLDPTTRAGHTHYAVYGRLCSSAIRLPELNPTPTGEPDFVLDWGPVGEAPMGGQTEVVYPVDGSTWMTVTQVDGVSWVSFSRGCRFRCEPAPQHCVRVVAEPCSSIPEVTVRHFFVDDLMPFLIAQGGAAILHGGAVELDGGALLILGASWQGKSTVLASFAHAGHPVVADDCIVMDRLNDQLVVQPGVPSIRLWETSPSFGQPFESGHVVAHYTSKRRFREALSFAPIGVPVSAIVELVRSSSEAWSQPIVVEQHGHEAAAIVLGAVRFRYHGHARREAFADAFEVARHARVGRVTVPTNVEMVPAVRDTLIRWLQ